MIDHDTSQSGPECIGIPDLDAEIKTGKRVQFSQGSDGALTIDIFPPDDLAQDTPQEGVLEERPQGVQQHPGHRIAWIVALFCLLALLIGAAYWTVPLFLSTPVTVTLVPITKTVTTQITMPGRPITLTLSQTAQNVKATGRGHQDARAARGLLTFYNASLSGQLIPAGTEIAGEIVTDADVWVPAAPSLATNGQASVWAHAVIVGPSGNLAAGSIYGPCRRLSLSVTNGAFTGGQDARDYRYVQQSDIEQAAQTMTPGLDPSVNTVFDSEVHPDETLSAVSCTPRISPSQGAGSEASTISVTVDETCSATAYPTQSLRNLLQVKGYVLTSTLIITGKQVTGTVVSQFSQAEQQQMKARIAGKTEEQAKHLLLSLPGVRSVGVSATLPTDPARIQFLIIE